MIKIPRLPVVALIASAFLLTSVAPSLAVESNSSLYNSLLKRIYDKSEAGDAGDIFTIIQRTLDQNPQSNNDLINRLMKTLRKNREAKLAFDVSKQDLDRLEKRLKRYQKKRLAARFNNTGTGGNITTPESPVAGG